ncbi:hypothetical protein [Caldicellulosiruptor morganii]|uniref:ABC transporter permease n=1 Tax=Caldicellulosiruptor morganii TaxID=1387555 RepID=A0ABY7BRS7_9FIRM|nr:hypothetical protein [Caldicellulosiruptor morganii]WAM34341.1 hypothetical protein OTK00_000525 [Caldicellulosiruptor morganii]
MELRKFSNLNLARKFAAYFTTLLVEFILALSMFEILSVNKTCTIDLILLQMFRANVITFFYVPLFLLLISSQGYTNNYLIILKYSYVEDWWKGKIKIFLEETLIYFLLIYTVPLIVVIILSSKYLKVLSYKEFVFIVESLIIAFLLLVIYGTVYLAVSTIIKKTIAAYVIGVLVPFIDFIFMYVFKTRNFSGITAGMLINFFMSYSLSTERQIFLFVIYLGYFLLLFGVLNIIMINTLKKIDVCRGDKKSEN